MKKIIGICGKKESGKTTLARHLQREYFTVNVDKYYTKENSEILSFASSLKQMMIDLFGAEHHHVYGSQQDKNSISYVSVQALRDLVGQDALPNRASYENCSWRELMQEFGSKICRHLDNDCWVNATMSKAEKSYEDYVIIDDVRFENECEAITSRGGILVKLTRNPHNDPHKSEVALDHLSPSYFDLYLDNENQTLEETQLCLREGLTKLLFE